jgi:geranylgeranyl diphosphate synthase, type II
VANSYRILIEQHLLALIPEGSELPHAQLFAAARLALANGKRLRPLLVLTAVEAYRLSIEKALTPACALELLHTYSLIHDDLPCMDNDDFRRGRPSLHRAFPESVALLTGDFLLTYAFELIARDSLLDLQKRVTLLSLLAREAGSEGMIGGQLVDLVQQEALNEEMLLFIQTRKTASLIATALSVAGILAEVENRELETLHRIGISLGIAFQFADDLLDEKGSFLYLEKKRIEQLINLYLTRALEEVGSLHADKESLSAFFHKMINEKLADKTPF